MKLLLTEPRLHGTVRAPSSKSEAHRALIAAALSVLYGGEPTKRRVRCTDLNEDIAATARCLAALGSGVERQGEYFIVTPITTLPREVTADCGESGSTLRFLLPVACALGSVPGAPTDFRVSFVGHGRLPERPLSPLYEALTAHGAILSAKGSNPLTVSGRLTAGNYTLDGGVSSQFISGLLFALPLLSEDSTVTVTGRVESAPYIDMTVDALARETMAIRGKHDCFRVTGRRHALSPDITDDTAAVGGDWSGAAFFLTAGVLAASGHAVRVTGLSPSTRQGDAAIVELLRRMGGCIESDAQGELVAMPSRLHGCVIDATQVPDLVPILAVAASVADGETRITGAARLRLKESDRLKTVSAMLTALGAQMREREDGLCITGVPRLTGGMVDAAGDHRIAMSAAIAATVCDGAVVLAGAESVAKSYPAFWTDYETITVSGGCRVL